MTDTDKQKLEWDSVKNEISNFIQSPIGKEYLRNITPLTANEIEIQLKEISEFKRIILESTAPEFSGIFDIKQNLLLSSKNAVLNIDDLYKIRQTIVSFDRLKKSLHKNHEIAPLLNYQAAQFLDISELKSELETSITEKCELNVQKYPHIERMHQSIESMKKNINMQLQAIISGFDKTDVLQEKIITTRNDRFVVLIKSAMKNKIDGTVVDASTSGQSYYFEPEKIHKMNNELILKKIELTEELYNVLALLSNITGKYSSQVIHNIKIAQKLEFIFAAAKFSILTKSNPPVLTKNNDIKLYSARHPLLEIMLKEKNVANDIIFSGKRVLIITGANTGGKTVLMKTVALCSLMIKYGLHIPAGIDSEIGLFTTIIADIGDDQNINESLSSFSGQIIKLKNILENANEGYLILLDEIMSGTNPKYGAALAKAILLRLASKNARVIVTTHYPELKEISADDNRFVNGSVMFDLQTLTPSYKFLLNVPGVSYTFEIAKIYGISSDIIEESKQFISEIDRKTEELISMLHIKEKEINEEKDNVENQKKLLETEIEKTVELKNKLKSEILKVKEGAAITFLEDIKNFKGKILERLREINTLSQKEILQLQTDISEAENTTEQEYFTVRMEKCDKSYSPVNINKLKIKSRVYIKSLAKEGIVEEINENNNTVQISLGSSIKSRFKIEDLLIDPKDQNIEVVHENKFKKQGYKIESSQDEIIPFTLQTSYNTLDIRGRRVEESLQMLNDFLDDMSCKNIKHSVIIHGHGTGSLKKAVRDWLKSSVYSSNYRAGENKEGGDGVTIVQI